MPSCELCKLPRSPVFAPSLVHAISDRARQFYEEWGFVASPVDPMTLRIAVTEAAREFVEKSR
jgi:hypothetical protein